MKTQKQHLNVKLQKSSVLFLQLGLVLALFFVYTALEFESIKKEFPLAEYTSNYEPDIILTCGPFVVEPIEDPVKPIIKKQILDKVITKPDDEPDFNKAFEPTDFSSEPTITSKIDSLPDDTGMDDFPEDIDFKILEDAPIFPGCEGLVKEASKHCFSKKISKFINKKFNTSIAESLNINGKQRIWVEFKVDKKGTVTDIKARSPHKSLEKEAIRVIQKIPQMTPGKQRLEPVNVKYTLPIIFQVY